MAIHVQRGATALVHSVHDANLKVMVDASNQTSDTGWLDPASAFLAGGTTLGITGTAKAALSIPESGSAVWSIRPNTAWNRHQLVLRAVYRGTSSTTANFSVTWTANGVTLGASASVTIGAVTVGIPGITTAGLVGAVETTLNTLPLVSTMETVGIQIARAASDAQGAVALLLLGAQWRVYAL